MRVKRIHAVITGVVQGVFFRRNTKIEADKLGLTGWVKNNEDGSVELVAEGEEEKLNKFLGWLRIGPPTSRVEKVEYEFLEATNEFKSFERVWAGEAFWKK